MKGSGTCDLGDVPVWQVKVLGCTGRIGSSTCDKGDVPIGQGPVLVI